MPKNGYKWHILPAVYPLSLCSVVQWNNFDFDRAELGFYPGSVTHCVALSES